MMVLASASASSAGDTTPDAELARQAEAEARRNLGDLTSPTSPRYWATRPIERARQLSYCGRMTAEQQARFYCDAARAAETRYDGSADSDDDARRRLQASGDLVGARAFV